MKISIPLPQKINSNLFDIYISLILLMPLTTLLQQYLDAINKVLFFVIFLFQLLILILRIDKKAMMFMTVSLFSYIVVIYNTKNLSFDNQIIYFVNWLIFATVISINQDKFMSYIKNNEFYIKLIMFIWSLLVGFSIVLPSSYYVNEGGATYFSSFTDSIFRLGPTALLIEVLALISIIAYKNKKDIIYTIIPLYCGFMGSSRTYFIVIVAVFVICLYYFASTKLRFSLAAIPSAAIGVILFTKSSINEKVQYTLDESQFGDFMYRITSSRSLIWENIWTNYLKLPFSKQFFGSGFGYTNRVSLSINRGTGVYAHNDFVEIIATHGILGIILYLIAFFILFKVFLKKKNIPILISALTIFTWVFNAFFNMFYWYICAALSYPFLLAAISYVKYQKEHPEPSDTNENIVKEEVVVKHTKTVNDHSYDNLHFAQED